jgi:outer membrane protein
MKSVCSILSCLILLQANSQTYSLQQCIDSAIANNLSVKRVQLQTKVAEVDWRQSKSNLLPNLNADVSQGYYSGRSIDPSTNAFVNQKYNGGTYGVNSGVTLFNGLTLQNRIRHDKTLHTLFMSH